MISAFHFEGSEWWHCWEFIWKTFFTFLVFALHARRQTPSRNIIKFIQSLSRDDARETNQTCTKIVKSFFENPYWSHFWSLAFLLQVRIWKIFYNDFCRNYKDQEIHETSEHFLCYGFKFSKPFVDKFESAELNDLMN